MALWVPPGSPPNTDPPSTEGKLISLHRYFIVADRMRRHFDETGRQAKEKREELVRTRGRPLEPEEGMQTIWEPVWIYMGSWYGMLYVVVEGWQEIGLKDSAIDTLLARQDKVELLKRYRNGAFHFQAHYYDDRFVNLMSDQDSAHWIRALHEAFNRWFIAWLKDRPENDG